MSTLPPRALRLATAPLLLAVLAACQTTPTAPSGPGNVSRLPPGNAQRDGPEAKPPPNLEAVPDAVPQIEAIRTGGPNKPYEIAGHTYVPMTDDRALSEKGLASWYGKKFHGRRTASGESYNMYAMTAAHKTLPIPSYARVRNPANGKEVIVRVNDRGPFAAGRIIDLSYTAALKLGLLAGVAPVEIERITPEDIRSGVAFKGAVASTTTSTTTAPLLAAVDTTPAPLGERRGLEVPPSPPEVAVVTTTRQTTTVLAPVAAAASAATAPAAFPASANASPREAPSRAFTPAAVGFWVQLGAYRQRDGALGLQQKLQEAQPWLAPLLAVYSEGSLHKLQAGPYATRDDARDAAEKIRHALQLATTIVEKR